MSARAITATSNSCCCEGVIEGGRCAGPSDAQLRGVLSGGRSHPAGDDLKSQESGAQRRSELVCTDGFWSSLVDARIAGAFVTLGLSLQDTLATLVAQAVTQGGESSDNTSAAALRLLD